MCEFVIPCVLILLWEDCWYKTVTLDPSICSFCLHHNLEQGQKLHTADQRALHFSGCQGVDLMLCKETSHHTCAQTETDSLVKGCWGNVSQQPSDSSGNLSPDTVSGMCSLISRLGQASTHGGRDWQFTACFQDWLDEWLKQRDGQLYNTDRVTEGWQVTPWQKGRKKNKTNPRTELPKAN